MEGNLCFKIDWASLINGRKFTFSTLFYFVFEGNFRVQAPRGAYIWRGDLMEGVLRYEFGGGGLYLERLIHGGAYFRNLTVFRFLNRFLFFEGKNTLYQEYIISGLQLIPYW